LLTDGVASQGVFDVYEIKIQQISSNEYELNIVIRLNEIATPPKWDVALLTSKLHEDATVKINVVEMPDYHTSILGRWKLVESRATFLFHGIQTIDYSQYNIVFEFKTNNVVSVSGMYEYAPILYEGGDHYYSIDTEEPRRINLGEKLKMWYNFASGRLYIGDASASMGYYEFVKLNK